MPDNVHKYTALDKLTHSEAGGPRGRLRRISNWEAFASHSCYNGQVLARLFGVSRRHLQRQIQARYGTTLNEWLNSLRIKHGYQRLAAGCSVQETAFSLGYKQVSHFSRNFKNHFGFTPSSVPITIQIPTHGSLPDKLDKNSPTQAR